jgi:hypothetical protein
MCVHQGVVVSECYSPVGSSVDASKATSRSTSGVYVRLLDMVHCATSQELTGGPQGHRRLTILAI